MEQLRKEGWNVNESLTAKFFADEVVPKSSQEILKTILDEDLREFGEPSIINMHRKEDSIFDGPCVLQLLRFRNVSVPRIKEEMNQADPAHSIVRLFLTDGHTSISAVLLESIPGINAETPPGTKILLFGNVPVEGIFLLLTKRDVKVIGGRVEPLIEKWNVERNSVRADGFKARNVAGKGTGAPKWVSFGKRGQKGGQLEKNFKANSVMPKNVKEGDEVDDFAKNREQVLKEIDVEQAKTFAKPNVDPPIQKEKVQQAPREPKEPKPRKEFKRRGRKNSDDGPDIDVGEYANHKPSGAVTLFDFIGKPDKEGVAKLGEEMSQMQVSSVRNEEKKSFGRGGGGGRGTFEPRNEHGRGRGEGNAKRGDRNQPAIPYGRGVQDGRGPRYEPKKFQERNDKNQGSSRNEYTRKQENQDRSTSGFGQSSSGKPNPRGNQNQPGHKTGNFQKEDSSRAPQQSNEFQRGPPRGPPQGDFQKGSVRGGHQNEFRGVPSQQLAHPPQGPRQPHNSFQRGGAPRPPHPQQNDFQRPPPRVSYQQQAEIQKGPPRSLPPHQNTFQKGTPRGNQHQRPPYENNGSPEWRVGSQCLAPWTDGALYPATITQLFPDGQSTIQFNQYGTFQTIPTDFLIFN